jgi:hypothetical protein
MPRVEVLADADDRYVPIFAESVGGGNFTVARWVPMASVTPPRAR